MKHLSIILTSLALAAIMLVPGVSFAMTPTAPHVTYDFSYLYFNIGQYNVN